MGIAIGGGSISVAALVVAFVQWSLKRNVAHEDSLKAELKQRLEQTAPKADLSKVEGRMDAIERRHEELKLQFTELKGEVRNVLALVSELRGLMHEMKSAMETGRDKQAQFYREELMKMEQLLRQDMTRAVQPDLGPRVAELERALSTLRTRRRNF